MITSQEIMKQIDPKYETIDQFVKRGSFIGIDGNIYLSSIEKTTGDILYNFKLDGEIKSYEYEHLVCPERSWTCDFLINNDIWLEIDGMRGNRKDPYKSGFNEKIELLERIDDGVDCRRSFSCKPNEYFLVKRK